MGGYDEDGLKSWEEYLEYFKVNIYPTIASYGLTFAEAFTMYQTNKLYNSIDELLDKLEELDDKGDWKK